LRYKLIIFYIITLKLEVLLDKKVKNYWKLFPKYYNKLMVKFLLLVSENVAH